MKILSRSMGLILMAFLFTACAPHLNWSQAMAEKMARYEGPANVALKPYFARAGVKFPPTSLGILVIKNTKRLQVYAKNSYFAPWRYIRTYPVLAASGGPGPKLHVSDNQVPEGIYHIIGMNPLSRFDLSMHLDYPNAFDKKMARQDGRTNLGGDIFIHGNHRSIGCVAIGNAAIQQLFPLVYEIGKGRVTVIIAPNDLRRQLPMIGRERLPWLPQLYRQIKSAMSAFPEPR